MVLETDFVEPLVIGAFGSSQLEMFQTEELPFYTDKNGKLHFQPPHLLLFSIHSVHFPAALPHSAALSPPVPARQRNPALQFLLLFFSLAKRDRFFRASTAALCSGNAFLFQQLGKASFHSLVTVTCGPMLV